MKDQLCTLLITFNDFNDPVKEITTAHNFSNTNPNFYPQHRRVVHSTQKESDIIFDSNAIIERISHSIRSSDSSILSSDFIENRTFNKKNIINNHLEKAFELSTQILNNNNYYDFDINTSPNNQQNVQEVTLTYMPENDAQNLETKLKNDATNKLSYTSTGSFQLNYSKNLPNLTSKKNVTQIQPYKIYKNAEIQFNNGKYFEISDSLQTQQNFQLLKKFNQKSEKYFTTPLQIETINLLQKQKTYDNQQQFNNNKYFKNDKNCFENKKIFNNNIDSQQTIPNFISDKKPYSLVSSTKNHKLLAMSSNTFYSNEPLEKHRETSYKSFKKYSSANLTHKTIIEQTTNEIKMSKNTTKKPVKCQNNNNILTENLINDISYKLEPTINKLDQNNSINEINKNHIRLYTRYDNNFDNNKFDENKWQKISHEKISTNFSSTDNELSLTVPITKLNSNNNNCNNNYASHQSPLHISLSTNNNNNTTEYFPHTIDSKKLQDEIEEKKEFVNLKSQKYNDDLYKKNPFNNNVAEDSLSNKTNFDIAQTKQQKTKSNFYSLLDSEKKLLENNSFLLNTSSETRLIDYTTYCQEINQLNNELYDYQNLKIEVPISPAIVINKDKLENNNNLADQSKSFIKLAESTIDSSNDQFSTMNENLNTTKKTTTIFPSIDSTNNLNKCSDIEQQQYTFKESKLNFLESFLKNQEPFFIQNQPKEYKYQRIQETLDKTKQHSIYLEKVTKKNFDITVNEISQLDSNFKDISIESYSASNNKNELITIENNSKYQEIDNFNKTSSDKNKKINKNLIIDKSYLISEPNFYQISKNYKPSLPKNSTEIAIQKNPITTITKTNLKNDSSTQNNFDDIENTKTLTGKQLLETLRRELQYEELINFEKHKCENAFYGNDLMRNNLILEPVQEEDDITSEDITSEEKIIEKSNLNKQDCFELSEINILNKYKDENSKNNKNTLTTIKNVLDAKTTTENIIKTVIEKTKDDNQNIEDSNLSNKREQNSIQNQINFNQNSSNSNFEKKKNLFCESLRNSFISNNIRNYQLKNLQNNNLTFLLPINLNMETDYRSTISSRQNFLRSNRSVSPTMNHRVLKMVSETSSLSSGLLSPYSGSVAALTIRDNREREKKDLSNLNDRLALYIEKVRFLEAQNRKLAADLNLLYNRWGKDSSNISKIYESEIIQAKKLIEDTNMSRQDLDSKIDQLYNEINVIRSKYEIADKEHYIDKDKIDELLFNLSSIEAEIALIKRRFVFFEEDNNVLKRENSKLLNELQRTRSDLDHETLNCIDAKNQVQTLLEEIDFLCRSHDSEIFDLQSLISRDTTVENREYFRNELLSAIRDIRTEHEHICNSQRTDMETWYKLKVQEIQTQYSRQNMEQNYSKEEIRRLRVQMNDLRGKLADLEGRNLLLEKQVEDLNYELEDNQETYESTLNERDAQIRKIRDECQILMVELQTLLDTKQSLNKEIQDYRKKLEGEENSIGLQQLVDQISTTKFKNFEELENRILKSEISRTSSKHYGKGNVAIKKIDNNFIIIGNTSHSKEEDIGEWKLRRRIDNGKKDIYFIFPKNYILKPLKEVKIWARPTSSTLLPNELELIGEESFGTGNHVQTILYNSQGEERVTVVQRA